MHIRQAGQDDLGAVLQIRARAYDVDRVRLGYLPAAAGEDVSRRIACGQVWVGETESEVVAVLVAEAHPDHLRVCSAVVDPGVPDAAHGSALMEHAREIAAGAGLGEVRVAAGAIAG